MHARALLLTVLVAVPFQVHSISSADTIGSELRLKRQFLETLHKTYYCEKVRKEIDQEIKVGDDFARHRALLGLADETRYLPYLQQFQFVYYRGCERARGHWRLEVLIDEQLRVTRVSVTEVRR